MHQENNQRGGKKKYKSGAQENTERMRLRILGIGRHCSARNAWNIHYSEFSSSSISSAFVKQSLFYKLVPRHTETPYCIGICVSFLHVDHLSQTVASACSCLSGSWLLRKSRTDCRWRRIEIEINSRI